MKQKMQHFVNAAQIISQLPAGDVKNTAISNLFGKDLATLGILIGDYVFNDNILSGLRVRQFVYSSDDGDCDVVIRVTEQLNGDQAVSITADIQ
jgi:hypothetical protein